MSMGIAMGSGTSTLWEELKLAYPMGDPCGMKGFGYGYGHRYGFRYRYGRN